MFLHFFFFLYDSQHYIHPAGNDGLFLVVDDKSNFREDNFQKAMTALTDTAITDTKGGHADKKAAGGKGDIHRIVKMIMERNYDPVIVFSFSKRKVEMLAQQTTGLDLTTDDEKGLIDAIFWNALDCLGPDDRQLPQVHALLNLLKRGVGIHHSGLLPILKEVVEVLFQEGLLKALFATETMSTGLNMPAKTVVFTSPRKFDGGTFRWVSSGEYIQMSGRAGRRGLDDRGIVILMADGKMEPHILKDMIKGAPDLMWSEFHLKYAMLLSMYRLEGRDPEHLMRKSFRQFQTERALPALQRQGERLKERLSSEDLEVPDLDAAELLLDTTAQLVAQSAQEDSTLGVPAVVLPFLQPGRLVQLHARLRSNGQPDESGGIEAIVNGLGRNTKDMINEVSSSSSSSWVVEALGVPLVWGVVVNVAAVASSTTADPDVAPATDTTNPNTKTTTTAIDHRSSKKRRTDGDGVTASDLSVMARHRPEDILVDVLVVCTSSSVRNMTDSSHRGARMVTAPVPLCPHRWARARTGGNGGGRGDGDGDADADGKEYESGTPTIISVRLSALARLATLRIYLPQDLRAGDGRVLAARTLAEVVSRQGGPTKVPLLDPVTDLRVPPKAWKRFLRSRRELEHLIVENPIVRAVTDTVEKEKKGVTTTTTKSSMPIPTTTMTTTTTEAWRQLGEQLRRVVERREVTRELKALKKRAKMAKALILKEELRARVRVLTGLGFMTEEGLVTAKGRAAAEIASADELVAVELLFSGALTNMTDENLVALLSCLVWNEKPGKKQKPVRLRPDLEPGMTALRDCARRVALVVEDARLPVDVEAYINGFRPDIMEAVGAWYRGAKFRETLRLLDVFEGSLVRAIRRLEELLRQLAAACQTVGETKLAERLHAADEHIKRDIVFAASLYL